LDKNSPDSLPVVFLTGFRVRYQPSAAAIPLNPVPDRGEIAVLYHVEGVVWKSTLPNGTVTDFISPSFNPGNVKYQQLTPDGPLAS
jgi:hypothetical protein